MPTVCEFYALGRCRKGDLCTFRHDKDARRESIAAAAQLKPQKPIPTSGKTVEGATTAAEQKQCYFFNAGHCWYGDSCRFAHGERLPPPPTPSNEKKVTMPVCTFFAKGECRFGDKCFRRHILDLEEEGVYENIPGPVGAVVTEGESGKTAAPEPQEEEEACGICLEAPSGYRPPRQYGLLEACDHRFCRECLMQWRSGVSSSDATASTENEVNLNAKTCPFCRVHSHVVISSKRFLQGTAKAEYINTVRAHREKIPCMYWTRRERCPFQHWCMYAHQGADGTDMKPEQKVMWEMRQVDREERRLARRLSNRRREHHGMSVSVLRALRALRLLDSEDEEEFYDEYNEWETEDDEDEDEDEDEDFYWD
ncbi:hypothetical protein HDU86_006820 [Geranomyces michiganensis]|nr:hypothetical protein HDU86_006820 [Geranomyces michiganensis]